MLYGLLAAGERLAVHPALVYLLLLLHRSHDESDKSSTLLLQCANSLLELHDPRLCLLSAHVFLKKRLYAKAITTCCAIEDLLKTKDDAVALSTARIMKRVAMELKQNEYCIEGLKDDALGGEKSFFHESGDVIRLLRGEVTAQELSVLGESEERASVMRVVTSDASLEQKATKVCVRWLCDR